VEAEQDSRVRTEAFAFLANQSALHDDVIPRRVLEVGFVFEGQRVPLLGPQGIFKPRVIQSAIPLSITTAPPVAGKVRPYDDEIRPDGFLTYRYRGSDPQHHENTGLRTAMRDQVPLVYLHGIVPGQYVAQWPVFVVGDDPGSLAFTVAVDDPAATASGAGLPDDAVRRRYMTRLAVHRLHQVGFRHRVLQAYRTACAVCHLRHSELLDAAHILPDGHPAGEPIVPNGLALCKIHHAAFDRHILGIRPDLVIEIREDILDEVDGPMLRHGLQETHGTILLSPAKEAQRPRREFLEERYALFRQAG
jgi:putative restriction endonuclease